MVVPHPRPGPVVAASPAGHVRPPEASPSGRVTEGRLREALRRDGSSRLPGGARVVSVHHAPVPEGAPDVQVVLVRTALVRDPSPLLVHLHGGWLVTGNAEDGLCAAVEVATAAGCAVASVEYRLAPSAPYPAAVEDTYAALVWLVDNADLLLIDPDRCVVAGEGAGGGLAAATALLARDLSWPRLAGQMLLRPMLDDRRHSSSAVLPPGAPWDATAARHGWQSYLGDRAGAPGVPTHAAPARETRLDGLPPTFVEVGEDAALRDEAVDFATRLSLWGTATELHVASGGRDERAEHEGYHDRRLEAPTSSLTLGARARWLSGVLHGARSGAALIGPPRPSPINP